VAVRHRTLTSETFSKASVEEGALQSPSLVPPTNTVAPSGEIAVEAHVEGVGVVGVDGA
jgi:hypothetical protein